MFERFANGLKTFGLRVWIGDEDSGLSAGTFHYRLN